MSNLSGTQYVGSGSSGPSHSQSDSGTSILAGGVQYVGYLGRDRDGKDQTSISAALNILAKMSGGTGTATGAYVGDGDQYVGLNSGIGTATNTYIDVSGIQFVGYNNKGIGHSDEYDYLRPQTICRRKKRRNRLQRRTSPSVTTAFDILGNQRRDRLQRRAQQSVPTAFQDVGFRRRDRLQRRARRSPASARNMSGMNRAPATRPAQRLAAAAVSSSATSAGSAPRPAQRS